MPAFTDENRELLAYKVIDQWDEATVREKLAQRIKNEYLDEPDVFMTDWIAMMDLPKAPPEGLHVFQLAVPTVASLCRTALETIPEIGEKRILWIGGEVIEVRNTGCGMQAYSQRSAKDLGLYNAHGVWVIL